MPSSKSKHQGSVKEPRPKVQKDQMWAWVWHKLVPLLRQWTTGFSELLWTRLIVYILREITNWIQRAAKSSSRSVVSRFFYHFPIRPQTCANLQARYILGATLTLPQGMGDRGDLR